MYLSFFSLIKEWLGKLIDKISWFNLIPFITGLILGLILGGLIYLIIIMTSVKREQRVILKNEIDVSDDEVKKAILSAQNLYKEDALKLSTNEKITAIRKISWNLIHDIAQMHYPESSYPIFELSVDEIFMLNYYITKRLEGIFSGRMLRKTKKLKIATIVKTLDMKKKIDENKIVKATAATTRSKPVRILLTVANSINPAFWAKKLFTGAILPATVNKIANIVIEIVGEETKRVYSKNAFLEDEVNKNIEAQIKDIEANLESEIK